MTKTSQQLKLLTLSAIFTALVFIATAYLPRIPFPGGYVHIGDAFIYLAAALLPTPYACAVGAIGAGLADALTGYTLYAPGTIIIKAVMALVFSNRKSRVISARNLTATVPAGIVCVGGYFLYEIILTSSVGAAAATIYFNLIQALASILIFVLLGFLFDKMDFRRRIGL